MPVAVERCVDLEAIWGDADAGLRIARLEVRHAASEQVCDDCSSDDDDDYAQQPTGSVVARMPCGDLHVCRMGKPCPFLVPNNDRIMVCVYTGVEHCPENADDHFDLNGGCGKRTGDPDATCGEPLNGKWVKRVDPVLASRLAFAASHSISEDTVAPVSDDVTKMRQLGKRPVKRSALCVGEDPGMAPRTKIGKKNTQSNDTRANLAAEADNVICKMINHKSARSFKQKPVDTKAVRTLAPADPRMSNEAFVFQKALQRYAKQCVAAGEPVVLKTVHNLALQGRDLRLRRQTAAIHKVVCDLFGEEDKEDEEDEEDKDGKKDQLIDKQSQDNSEARCDVCLCLPMHLVVELMCTTEGIRALRSYQRTKDKDALGRAAPTYSLLLAILFNRGTYDTKWHEHVPMLAERCAATKHSYLKFEDDEVGFCFESQDDQVFDAIDRWKLYYVVRCVLLMTNVEHDDVLAGHFQKVDLHREAMRVPFDEFDSILPKQRGDSLLRPLFASVRSQ